MPTNRREFLRLSALLASGLALPFYACDSGSSRQTAVAGDTTSTANTTSQAGKPLERFGIQLWTVKEDMAKDPRATLKQLASYGYKQIESFEGQQGIFWGMSNKEFKTFVEDLDMQLVASHANVKENFEAKAAQAAEIGMQYLIDPYEGPQKSLDDFKRMAERFNQYGEICQKNGLRFAYHNHDYTFQEIEGTLPQNLLLEQTDKELVDFELDMYWLVAAGGNLEEHLKAYAGRYKLGHVKDRRKEAAAEDKDASTMLGTGSIDYANVLKTARDNGMEYFFVEQERFDNTTPLESSKQNAAYLKSLQI